MAPCSIIQCRILESILEEVIVKLKPPVTIPSKEGVCRKALDVQQTCYMLKGCFNFSGVLELYRSGPRPNDPQVMKATGCMPVLFEKISSLG